MSSSDNNKFNTTETSKQAGQDVYSDAVVLPPDSTDHVLTVTADASCTAGVDVELEMSPDKENWCPAVTKLISADVVVGETIAGNEEYVNLVPDAPGEFKNKHARGGLNFDNNGAEVETDGTGTRDLLHQHMGVDKSFNYSMWTKSTEQPSATYKPVLFRHGGKDTQRIEKAIEFTSTTPVVSTKDFMDISDSNLVMETTGSPFGTNLGLLDTMVIVMDVYNDQRAIDNAYYKVMTIGDESSYHIEIGISNNNTYEFGNIYVRYYNATTVLGDIYSRVGQNAANILPAPGNDNLTRISIKIGGAVGNDIRATTFIALNSYNPMGSNNFLTNYIFPATNDMASVANYKLKLYGGGHNLKIANLSFFNNNNEVGPDWVNFLDLNEKPVLLAASTGVDFTAIPTCTACYNATLVGGTTINDTIAGNNLTITSGSPVMSTINRIQESSIVVEKNTYRNHLQSSGDPLNGNFSLFGEWSIVMGQAIGQSGNTSNEYGMMTPFLIGDESSGNYITFTCGYRRIFFRIWVNGVQVYDTYFSYISSGAVGIDTHIVITKAACAPGDVLMDAFELTFYNRSGAVYPMTQNYTSTYTVPSTDYWAAATNTKINLITDKAKYIGTYYARIGTTALFSKKLDATDITNLLTSFYGNTLLASTGVSNLESYYLSKSNVPSLSTTTIFDQSGNGNDIINTSGVNLETIYKGNLIIDVSNGVVQHIKNTGVNTYISAINAFSIQGWFNTDTTPKSDTCIFSNTTGTSGVVTEGIKCRMPDSTSIELDFTTLGTTISYTTPSSILDGTWHNIILTKNSNSAVVPGTDLKLYLDGVELTPSSTSPLALVDTDLKGTNGFCLAGDGTQTTGSDNSSFKSKLSQWSIHSKELSVDEIFLINNRDVVPDLEAYGMSVEAYWELNDAVTPTQDATSNNYDLVFTDANSQTLDTYLINLQAGEKVLKTGQLIDGNAFTVTLTKSFNFTTEEWVETYDQECALCLSFNGVEKNAEYFALFKCNQNLGAGAVDLLDGGWHNIIISYRGNNDLAGDNVAEGDIVKFGPGPLNSLDFNFAVSFDGQPLTTINAGRGVDYVGGLNTIETDTYQSQLVNVGFPIFNRHLKFSGIGQDEYQVHAQFSAGIYEVSGGDNENAFQGAVDETSFHSDCWWVDQAGTSVLTNTYNQEKPATIYGNTTALTNRGTGSDYPTGAPYPLLTPEVIGSTAGGNQWISPDRYDAATNPTGGLEGWWRWGDTPGDCSITINDVRDHDAGTNKRDINAFGIITADRVLMTSAPESIYVENVQTEGSANVGITYPQVTVSEIQSGVCNLSNIDAPILQFVRVKWTGSGSCDLGPGKGQASISFRKRRKK